MTTDKKLMTHIVKEYSKYNSPCIIYNLNKITYQSELFFKYFPNIEPFYAVKANPAPQIIKTLKKQTKICFDVASINEIKLCLSMGIPPHKLSYANICKKTTEIEEAYNLGVRLFVFDSEEELKKIAQYAPNSNIMCRIMTQPDINSQSAWSLGEKFGCSYDMAYSLLNKAKKLNLIPYGIAFHVGSQTLAEKSWEKVLQKTSLLWKKLLDSGTELKMLNMGGGLPVKYLDSQNLDIKKMADKINESLNKYFKKFNPRIIMEPGRFLVAESAILLTEVILTSKKEETQNIKWAYLDMGRYNGLIETVGDSIKFFIKPLSNFDKKVIEYKLAGNTCDSFDTWYQHTLYELPKTLKCGDILAVYPAGAYVGSCGSKGFNGFDNPTEIFLEL